MAGLQSRALAKYLNVPQGVSGVVVTKVAPLATKRALEDGATTFLQVYICVVLCMMLWWWWWWRWRWRWRWLLVTFYSDLTAVGDDGDCSSSNSCRQSSDDRRDDVGDGDMMMVKS